MRHFLLWWETNMKGTVGRFVVSMDHMTVIMSCWSFL
jgi:hypothetical protein